MTQFPEYAKVDGQEYKINTDYRVALRCFEVIDDPDICDEERAMAVCFLLFGFIPNHHMEDFMRIAQRFLQCGEDVEDQRKRPKDMDFQQDEKYIVASFMSDYHIDLPSTDMHFWQFCTLLTGLTENSSLSKVRELRTFDLSDIKDQKTRNKIQDAQDAVALKHRVSKEEQEMIDEFESLLS